MVWLLRDNTPAAGCRKQPPAIRARTCGFVPMSTIQPNSEKPERTERFEPTAEPRPLRVDDLRELRQPQRNLFEAAAPHESVAFAVAVRGGRLVTETPMFEYDSDAVAVLYVTADGERVVERHQQASSDDLRYVPRAVIAPDRQFEPVDEHAARFAPVVQRHPET